MRKIIFIAMITSAMGACVNNGQKNVDEELALSEAIERAETALVADLMKKPEIVIEKEESNTSRYMKSQQSEIEEILKEELARNELNIQRLPNETLIINLTSETSFRTGRSSLKPRSLNILQKIAKIITDYPESTIDVIGHTDSVGFDVDNMKLSQKRANAVVKYLTKQKIDATRLMPIGRGESEPIADNASRAGRKLNRRVEIHIKPIIQEQQFHHKTGHI